MFCCHVERLIIVNNPKQQNALELQFTFIQPLETTLERIILDLLSGILK